MMARALSPSISGLYLSVDVTALPISYIAQARDDKFNHVQTNRGCRFLLPHHQGQKLVDWQ